MGDVKMAKKKQRRIFLMKDIPNFCLKKFNVNSVPSTLLVSWSTHFDYYNLATKRNIYSPFSLFKLALLGSEQSLIFLFGVTWTKSTLPCPPQPLFDSPQTSCGTPEAKVGGSA